MKFIKTILGIIFVLILSETLFILFLDINISKFFTKEEMENTVEKIDISHEINKIKNSSATSENKAEIADIINSAYTEAENHGISSNLVEEIFNSNEVKRFLGKIAGTTTDNIINGAKLKPVTSEEFNKLLDDNIDKWIKQSKIKISDSKKEVLVIRMKTVAKGVIDNLPQVTDQINQNDINKINFIFSNKVKITLIIVSIISFLLIILVKHQKGLWLLYSGTSILISGLAIIILSLLIGDIITYALQNYNLSFLVSAFSNTLSKNLMITGLIQIIISVLMYIIYIIHNKRVNQ